MSVSHSTTTNDSDAQGAVSDEHLHPKPRYDDVNIPVIFMLGTFSAIMTFVIICFVQGLYYSWNETSVQRDWRSSVMTPQEKTIFNQRSLRDGFFETKDGKYFVSVDVAAEKLLSTGGDVSELKDFDLVSNSTVAKNPDVKNEKEKPETEKPARPEPPGPEKN